MVDRPIGDRLRDCGGVAVSTGYRCDYCGKFAKGNPTAMQGQSQEITIGGFSDMKLRGHIQLTWPKGDLTMHEACMKKANIEVFKAVGL